MLTSIDIGNAKIEGLEDSLGMTDTDYNVRTFKNDTNQAWLIISDNLQVAVAIFFVPYVL